MEKRPLPATITDTPGVLGPDHRLLLEILAPSTLPATLPRTIAFEDDPFGLLEINDTYDRLLGQGYNRAINLAENIVPQLESKTRKLWANGKTIELPEKDLGDFYRFSLTVQRDPKNMTGFVHFRRTDESGKAERGFQLCRLEDGHIVLRDEARGIVDPENSEVYGDMVEKALRWLKIYAAQFGLMPEALNQLPYHPSKSELIKEFTHLRLSSLKNRIKASKRKLATGVVLAGLVTGASTPFYMRMKYEEGKTASKRLATEIQGEQRAAFDVLNLDLPRSAHILRVGETNRLSYSPDLSEQILKQAPRVDAWKPQTAELEGGPRHLINTYWVRGPRPSDRLVGTEGNGRCLEIPVELGPNARVQVTSVDTLWSQSFDVTVNRNNIRICNISGKDVTTGFDQIYTEITDA